MADRHPYSTDKQYGTAQLPMPVCYCLLWRRVDLFYLHPSRAYETAWLTLDFLPPSRPAGGGNGLHALVLSTISVAASGGVS